MGIRDRPTSLRSPWQNPYAERLIGTLRRECLDHVLIFGERHLLRILSLYSTYYNQTRTHLALSKDAPLRIRSAAQRRPLSRRFNPCGCPQSAMARRANKGVMLNAANNSRLVRRHVREDQLPATRYNAPGRTPISRPTV